MSHNLDTSNGRYNIAFMGDRNDIWHRHGQQMKPGQSIREWAKQAGLDWSAVLVPAMADLSSLGRTIVPVDGARFIARDDTGAVLGRSTDAYQLCQPSEVLEWFDRYISVDDRFKLDVAGSLKGGAIIWATATFNGDLSIAGDRHIARVLMSTTFDASAATKNRMTTTRVVCNNTFDVANTDNRAVISTSHRSKFDAARVGKELAALAQGVAIYKQVGDALAQNEMAVDQVSNFFKTCLDIPFDVKKEDVSARKLNQFAELNAAYRTTVTERGGKGGDAWTALQAVTRYVDHDRSVKKGAGSEETARFASSQFGAGADLKTKAIGLLLPRIADKVKLAA